MPVLLSHSEREARALRKLAQCRAQAWEKGWAPLTPRRQQVDPGGIEQPPHSRHTGVQGDGGRLKLVQAACS